MKFKIKKSYYYRKTISLILLFYFLTSPIIFAIPQQHCTGMCKIDMLIDQCEENMQINTMTNCCNETVDKTKTGINDVQPNNVKHRKTKCKLEINLNSNVNYLIPVRHNNNEVSFIEDNVIYQFRNEIKFTRSDLFEFYVIQKSLPIYLTHSALLI